MLSGCGSASVHELPPAAEPPRAPAPAVAPAGRVVSFSPLPQGIVATQPGGAETAQGGRALAVLSVRERVLELYAAGTQRRTGTAPAGVGPTHVACMAAWCWVTDTRGGALLVFSTRPKLEPTRRLYLPGGPYGIALDERRRRLFVTLPARNELVELPAHGRPHVLRRWPTVRQPGSVAVDPASGRVFVTGSAGDELQILRP